MKLLFFGFLSLGGSALGTAPRAHELTDDYSYEKYIADFRKTESDNSRRLFHERLAAIRKHNSNQLPSLVLAATSRSILKGASLDHNNWAKGFTYLSSPR